MIAPSSAVSILIPCHNAAHWVGQAIESALAQTARDTEIIVLDDGSSDASLDVIRGFDGRIRIETCPNRGAPAARNRLLELATGSWVQYLDADDYLLPDKIAVQLSALSAIPPVDVIYGPATIEWHDQGAVRLALEPIPEPHDTWRLLALWHLPQTGAPLWRKAALEDVGGWRAEQPCCQEHELYLRLLVAGKRFAYNPSNGAVYRRFPAGTLSTRNPALVRRERAKIERRLEEHLAATGSLTPERRWAIDQARFEMARSAWADDRAEARGLHGEITSRQFYPNGIAAPPAYRLVYRAFGFEVAERVAEFQRGGVGGRRNRRREAVT